MKKWLLTSGMALLLLIFIPLSASARVGGSMGGSGGSTGSGHSTTSTGTYTNDRDDYYYGHRGYGYGGYGYGTGTGLSIVFFGFFGFLIIRPGFRRWRERRQTAPTNTIELPSDFEATFEPFFYKMEEAWTKNDLTTLRTMMTSHYFAKQQRILRKYARKHKTDQLDGLVIVNLEQVLTDSDRQIEVVVTAQARDYFHYDNRSEAFNQRVYEAANIERFTEVWTLSQCNDGQLLLHHIRPVA
ncbi:hypothetical protein [Lactiplantibacillus mudanjiangensis]|uniref:Tim44-like domain-containing protein n=1 Tax=Lactiplantibacillus mudanjiangensis TaxID=1296538 RepID=A0A660E4B2_9LACO|nr:hypothetical protein [Lactiplantibacillus mudanjiangensis]VDG19758.1 hypothetical protein [Lactobacillus heilongjiangensis] [Lactiplantibacillus mudanjiangensis]VDG24431.1 hypothetical protein [Lactobacillus heilongjiangensis] [Lactiplantibacillus mudanjiangensis]VDG27765.1 hypothetical protein [Lactobacillus heilongjiangensis] [Lactiplantibacillus mudanjiangensis]VDG31187.1 hypothetical protein [Lactobacillus heilongjiangensis] [Lactiplantibacillus mudanjiangensis]